MNKPKTPPCIGHDQETEVLEEIVAPIPNN
jgi:hypothetical protein